ncbi:hypothetical protein [Metabacillus litoralis]|uniref:hypothetical protein n=1 Tax=Metabacillus litoralis TaxID=152268 RepID=UPI001CFD093A|nr:hypothetical protein [Metabacillus litoralis]
MDKIVDFTMIRKEKEDRLLTFSAKHIEEFQYFVEREVNIREKVKAKHIFRQKNEIEFIDFTNSEELLFQDWFTYDYLTVKGLTIYQSYVTSFSKNQMHPLHSVIHALFMASVLEPFKVIKIENNHIYAEKLLTKEKCEINIMESNKRKGIKEEEVIFLRTIPIFEKLLCISGIFVQKDIDVVNNLLNDINKSEDNWRTFLKKYSIKYTWAKDSTSSIKK